jgi:hypothetical protein
MANKAQLLEYLDKHVFHPILYASERDIHGNKEREDLIDLKKRTEQEKARFHGYDSAEKIVAMYKDDLHSEKARPINARLQDFGLPRLVDVKDDFLKLAGEGS